MVKIDLEIKKKINQRINRIVGQLQGINKMIETDRTCEEILIQISASNNALKSLSQELLKNHMITCMKEDILNGKDESIEEVMDLIKKIQ